MWETAPKCISIHAKNKEYRTFLKDNSAWKHLLAKKQASWGIRFWQSWCFYCKYCIFNLHGLNHRQSACFTKDGHRFRTTGRTPLSGTDRLLDWVWASLTSWTQSLTSISHGAAWDVDTTMECGLRDTPPFQSAGFLSLCLRCKASTEKYYKVKHKPSLGTRTLMPGPERPRRGKNIMFVITRFQRYADIFFLLCSLAREWKPLCPNYPGPRPDCTWTCSSDSGRRNHHHS